MIVADTSGLLASVDSSAAQHDACAGLLRAVEAPLLVSHMVIAETDHLLTARFGVVVANQFLTDVARGAFQLAPTDEQDVAEAVTINVRYAEHRLGVTDCLNVVLAKNYGTVKLFTLDERHYRAVRPLAHGPAFALLPKDG